VSPVFPFGAGPFVMVTFGVFGVSFGDFGDFCDFGVSFTATVAGFYSRLDGPRLSVRGGPLIVPTRGPLYLLCKTTSQ